MASMKPVETPEDAFLQPTDTVAISFWIISIAMIAATVFFYAEAATLHSHWKTSLHVGGLVTLVAGVHYFYMREYWVLVHQTPIVYRYIDWSITVPLQMIEFNLILSAVNPNIGAGMFWRLLIGTVVMLSAGYCGELSIVKPYLGFYVGLAGWVFILCEVFVVTSMRGLLKSDAVSKNLQISYYTMAFIVTVGWSIYPMGYYFGYLKGSVSEVDLNVLYNLADFVNKIAFCVAIWACAKAGTKELEGE